MENKVYRGEIYYIHETEVSGNEQAGGRPGIIVSNDVGNEHSPVVTVVYLTTQEKKPLPTHVKINTAIKPSVALCEQIYSVDKGRIWKYINEVSEGELKNLEKAMLVSLGIQTNLKGMKYLEVWRKMAESYYAEERSDTHTVDKTLEEGKKDRTDVTQSPLPPRLEDIKSEPDYIRVVAQRDLYKELYIELLNAQARSAEK